MSDYKAKRFGSKNGSILTKSSSNRTAKDKMEYFSKFGKQQIKFDCLVL